MTTSSIDAFVSDYPYHRDGFWLTAPGPTECDWKLHVFADTPEDWLQVAAVVLPYCQTNRIAHKTVDSAEKLLQLAQNGMQRGKAFTIYSGDIFQCLQNLQTLDQLLYDARLIKPPVTAIYGDRAFGRSGRLFYRYDKDLTGNYRLNDGSYKPQGLTDPFAHLSTGG